MIRLKDANFSDQESCLGVDPNFNRLTKDTWDAIFELLSEEFEKFICKPISQEIYLNCYLLSPLLVLQLRKTYPKDLFYSDR